MKYFNWDKYYEDLEMGDPSRFPFWQFLIHEVSNVIYHAVIGCVIGVFMIVWAAQVVGFVVKNYPNGVSGLFNKAVCETVK